MTMKVMYTFSGPKTTGDSHPCPHPYIKRKDWSLREKADSWEPEGMGGYGEAGRSRR